MTKDSLMERVSPRYEGLTRDQFVGALRLDVGTLPIEEQVRLSWHVEQAIRAATRAAAVAASHR